MWPYLPPPSISVVFYLVFSSPDQKSYPAYKGKQGIPRARTNLR